LFIDHVARNAILQVFVYDNAPSSHKSGELRGTFPAPPLGGVYIFRRLGSASALSALALMLFSE
jgi:hypothetical protein